MGEEVRFLIVGAGLSGVGCAYGLVKDHGVVAEDILILEANDYIGGRIKSTVGDGFVIEEGAEFIHGEQNSVYKLLSEADFLTTKTFCTSQGDGGPDSAPVNGKVGTYFIKRKETNEISQFSYDSLDKNFLKAHQLIHNIHELPQPRKDTNLLDYLLKNNISEEMTDLLEAGYANTYCSSLSDLSLNTLAKWNKYWVDVSGDDDYEHIFQFPFSYSSFLTHLIRNSGIEDRIKLNSPVTQIQILPDKQSCVVHLGSGTSIRAERVVVSVSPAVLKQELIKFIPELSQKKNMALKSIKMNPAMKLVLLLNRRIWPSNLSAAICGNFDFPEVWFKSVDESRHLVTGFATAGFASKLIPRGQNELESSLIEQLREIFSFEGSVEVIERVLSVWDEKSAPYIGGGYHSPHFCPDFDENYSRTLSEPIEGRIFFCGEAINEQEGTTTSAAFDSGLRAAKIAHSEQFQP